MIAISCTGTSQIDRENTDNEPHLYLIDNVPAISADEWRGASSHTHIYSKQAYTYHQYSSRQSSKATFKALEKSYSMPSNL